MGALAACRAFPGSVFTHSGSRTGASRVEGGREKEPGTSTPPPSPAETLRVGGGSHLIPTQLQEMEPVGGGGVQREGGSAGECHVDFAPMLNSWPCSLDSCVTLGKSLTLSGLRCLSVKWVL